MVSSLTLVLTLAAATPRAAPAHSERPECDEATDDLAAAVQLPDEQALTPAPHPEDCSDAPSQADAPPVVIDCNDARSDIWVRAMIGSCAMPRAQVGAARAERRDPIAFGAPRTPDRAPAPRTVPPSDQLPPWLHAGALLLTPDLSASPLVERAAAAPRTRARDRIERPPRA